MRVYDRAFPGEAAYDAAVSRALLLGAAEGAQPECLRLYRPDAVVAFSGSDAARPGFARAVQAARQAGFDAALRLAGGSAAVFHPGALAFASAGEPHDATTALLLVATYAFVARVRFQLGPGLVRPTQLVLVPMLFLLAPLIVPALVAGASTLSELPEIARRRAHPERLLVAIADCWHTVGPAIVVAALAYAVYLVWSQLISQ